MNSRRKKRSPHVGGPAVTTDLEKRWRFATACQPSSIATHDQLSACLGRDVKDGNDLVKNLAELLIHTKSAKIAEAIREIIRLGLAGPDWQAKAEEMGRRIAWPDSSELSLTIDLLATGASGRKIAREIAVRYGGRASIEAASKAAYRRVRTMGPPIETLLNIPLAERRQALKIARAKLGLNNEQAAGRSVFVLNEVLEAYASANKRQSPNAPLSAKHEIRTKGLNKSRS